MLGEKPCWREKNTKRNRGKEKQLGIVYTLKSGIPYTYTNLSFSRPWSSSAHPDTATAAAAAADHM